MPLDYSDPKVAKFFNDCIEHESKARVRWTNLYVGSGKIQIAATQDRELKNNYDTDVIKYKLLEGMATISRDHIAAACHRRKIPIRDGKFIQGVASLKHGHSIPEVGLGDQNVDPKLGRPDTDLRPDPVMRPVDLRVRKLLYKSKPTPKPNREIYLDKRVILLPEKKYYFPECTNWDYGWRQLDSELRQKPLYGRCWHLHRALTSRVGPQPDPPHYKSSDSSGSTKC